MQKCDFSVFWPEIPFSRKFGSEIQNCLLKVKFGTYTTPNVRDSVVMFIFSFRPEKPFLRELGPKIQNRQGSVMFIVSVFE